jgi:hypothetical protein
MSAHDRQATPRQDPFKLPRRKLHSGREAPTTAKIHRIRKVESDQCPGILVGPTLRAAVLGGGDRRVQLDRTLVDGIVRGTNTVPAGLTVTNAAPLALGGKGMSAVISSSVDAVSTRWAGSRHPDLDDV